MEENKPDINAEDKEGVHSQEQVFKDINIEINTEENQKSEDDGKSDPVGLMAWAGILVWVGFVFLARNLGWLKVMDLPNWLTEEWSAIKNDPWILILLGAGLIILVEGIIRLIFPPLRKTVGGTFLFAAIVLCIALSMIYNWQVVWPIILIGFGVSLLVRGLVRGKK